MNTYYIQPIETNKTHYKKKKLEFDYIKSEDFDKIKHITEIEHRLKHEKLTMELL